MSSPARGEGIIDAGRLDGPLRVLAGPGAGKTHTLVSLYQDLVQRGLAERSQILVLTFSNSAASELSRRIDERLRDSYPQAWISTFHSFCARLLGELRPDPARLLLSGFQEWVVMRRVLEEIPAERLGPLDAVRASDAFARDALAFVALMKQNLIHQGRLTLLAESGGSARLRALAHLYADHQARLTSARMFDFRDLVAETIGQLESRPALLETIRGRFRYILIDEFQDVDPAQFDLVRLLAPPERRPRLVVVGDPDQSIYGFRGSLPTLLAEEFGTIYAAETLRLEASRRCPDEVMDRAQTLLDRTHQDRRPRRIRGREQAQPAVLVVREASGLDEAFFVARQIRRLMMDSGGRLLPGDFAILLRSTTTLATPFEEALRAVGLVPEIHGGGATQRNQVIHFLLHYLLSLEGPDDGAALGRILDSSLSGVPLRAWSRLRAHARRQGRDPLKQAHRLLYQLAREHPERYPLPWQEKREDPLSPLPTSPARGEGPESFLPLPTSSVGGEGPVAAQLAQEFQLLSEPELAALHAALTTHHKLRQSAATRSLAGLAHAVMIETGATRRLLDLPVDNPLRLEALSNLQVALEAFAEVDAVLHRLLGRAPTLADAAPRLEAMVVQAVDDSEPGPAGRGGVRILTVHQAKGLEFEVVFLSGLAQGVFPIRARPHALLEEADQAWLESSLPDFRPSWPAAGDGHLAEEARLAYVGMTRARHLLYLTHADEYTEAAGPSPFLEMVGAGEALDYPRAGGLPEDVLTMAEGESLLATMRPRLNAGHLAELESLGVDLDFVLAAESGQPFLPHDGPRPAGVSPHHFSPTQITDYLRCPRLYWYNHHPGLAPPPPGPEMARGRFLHQVLENFHRREEEWRSLPTPEQRRWLEATLQPLLEPYLSQMEAVLDRRREEQEVRRILDNYMAFATSFQKVPRRGTVETEKRFVLDIAGSEIHGVIDRIIDTGNGTCEVVDYKTGNGSSLSRAHQNYFSGDMYDVQLAVYYLACLHGTDPEGRPLALNPRFLSLWYPKEKVWGSIRQALFTVGTPLGLSPGRERMLTEEELERGRSRLIGAVARIRAGDFAPDPRDVAGTCVSFTGCPHASICPFARTSVD